MGNHDYGNGDGDASAARSIFGLPADGWYSYRLGSWRVVVLNSNCAKVGGCEIGSRQWRWLQMELLRARAACVLAYWHHPRFSSGQHGSDRALTALWNLLAGARADVVVAGHDHDYERFAPIDGIRSFVVGTGGRGLRPFGAPVKGSAVRQAEVYGALQLTLGRGGYSWRFLGSSSGRFADAGSARCR